MRLSKNIRQILGAAAGAAIAAAISTAFALPAVERHERVFEQPEPEQVRP